MSSSTLSIVTGSQLTGQFNTPFSLQLNATGGYPPYNWSMTGQAWLILNPTTGMLTGLPTATGSYGVTVTVKDSQGSTASQGFQLNVPWVSTITSPAPGLPLTGGQTAFSWTPGPPGTQYGLFTDTVPTNPGACSANMGTALTGSLALPTSSQTSYVTLCSLISGAWQALPYRYTINSGPLQLSSTSSPTAVVPNNGAESLQTYTFSSGSPSILTGTCTPTDPAKAGVLIGSVRSVGGSTAQIAFAASTGSKAQHVSMSCPTTTGSPLALDGSIFEYPQIFSASYDTGSGTLTLGGAGFGVAGVLYITGIGFSGLQMPYNSDGSTIRAAMTLTSGPQYWAQIQVSEVWCPGTEGDPGGPCGPAGDVVSNAAPFTVDAPPACATPVNFRQTGPGVDQGGGTLSFVYNWDSSTGNLNDLASCKAQEKVTYDKSPWPSPPFPHGLGANNPEINEFTPSTSEMGDDHSTPGAFVKPYSLSVVNASQIYRWYCPCYQGGNWQTFAAGISISRQVTDQLFQGTWVFQVCKTGVTPQTQPPGYFCALIKPLN